MKRIVVNIIYFISFSVIVYAQSNDLLLEKDTTNIKSKMSLRAYSNNEYTPEVVPISPNAASLGIYGSTDISPYTGAFNLSIPIYEINLEGKSIPISLSYYTTGTFVAAEASWAGLGWALNAGGCITRSVNGKDDFAYRGYLENTIVSNWENPTQQELVTCLDEEVDTQPDVYSFNFLGYSGTFILKNQTPLPTKTIINKDHSSLKILTNGYNKWEITDEQGYKYYFSTLESTETRTLQRFDGFVKSVLNFDEFSTSYGACYDSPVIATAWYLDSIVSPQGNKISFEYKFDYIYSPISFSESNVLENAHSSSYNGDYLYFRSKIHQAHLSKIKFGGGEVEFLTTDRDDIRPVISNSKPQKLSAIIVKDMQGDTYRNYSFDYEYLSGGKLSQSFDDRLLLTAYHEKAKTSATIRTHTFIYNKGILPNKSSLSKDIWGYYNGAAIPSSTNLLRSKTTATSPTKYAYGILIRSGVDKGFKEEYAKIGTLKSVIYPTGGKTEITLEGHRLSEPLSAPTYDGRTKVATIHKRVGYLRVDIGNTDGAGILYDTFVIDADAVSYLKLTRYHDILHPDEIDYNNGNIPYRQYQAAIQKLNPQTKEFEDTEGPSKFHPVLPLHDENNSEEFLMNEPIIGSLPGPLQSGTYRLKLWYEDGRLQRPHAVILTAEIGATIPTSSMGEEMFIGGGLRVKEWKNILPNGVEEIKSYEYKEGKHMVPIIYDLTAPLSNMLVPGVVLPYEKSENYYSDLHFPLSHSIRNNVVGYDFVAEYNGDFSNKAKNGYTEYSYFCEPDIIPDNHIRGALSLPYLYNGLLASKTVFTSIGKLLLKETYKYQPLKTEKIIGGLSVGYRSNNGQTAGSYIYWFTEKYLMQTAQLRSISKTMTNDLGLNTTTAYTYDDKYLLPKKELQTDSKGNEIAVSYQYPFDYISHPLYKEMTEKNILASKLEQKTEIAGKQTKQIITGYYKDNVKTKGHILPQKIEVSDQSEVSKRIVLSYDLYDPKGNLLQYTGLDGIPISYFWSYNYQYPIAEFKNMTYAQAEAFIKSHFGIASADVLAKSLVPDEAKIRSLTGINTSAHITTYTYKPLVGMLSATDPSGITTYYNYDSFGRLKETYIMDNGKKVIQMYDYKYRNQ